MSKKNKLNKADATRIANQIGAETSKAYDADRMDWLESVGALKSGKALQSVFAKSQAEVKNTWKVYDEFEAKSAEKASTFQSIEELFSGIRFRTAEDREHAIGRVVIMVNEKAEKAEKEYNGWKSARQEAFDAQYKYLSGENSARLDHEKAHIRRLQRALRTLAEFHSNAIIEATYEDPPSTAVTVSSEGNRKAMRTRQDVHKEEYGD